jgi:hypothetical protein
VFTGVGASVALFRLYCAHHVDVVTLNGPVNVEVEMAFQLTWNSHMPTEFRKFQTVA